MEEYVIVRYGGRKSYDGLRDERMVSKTHA